MTETMWTCCDSEVYDTPGVIEHLRLVHGIEDAGKIRMRQRCVMHVDGEDFSLNTYECDNIGDGIMLLKTVKITP